MKSFKCILFCLLALSGTIVAGDLKDSGGGIGLNSNFDLSKKSEKRMVMRARKGDPAAAFRLYLFYTLVRYDEIEGLFWLRTAAALGHPTAELNLGRCYADERGIVLSDLAKAKTWLERAKKDGVREAADDLKQLEAITAERPAASSSNAPQPAMAPSTGPTAATPGGGSQADVSAGSTAPGKGAAASGGSGK